MTAAGAPCRAAAGRPPRWLTTLARQGLAAALLSTVMLGQEHWSLAPVRRPPVPTVPGLASTNPIDAFVARRLASAGLSLAPPADRTTLIRRLYLVMLGVPPEPAAVTAFASDPREDAFEALVDRVLADPRYGERWARHWLDVVRFAETNGFETNRERLGAWRYRDWVIGAWNQDLPYAQFVQDQIAGDAYGADDAVGFLVGGPHDIVGSPDPALTAQQRADQLDDMASTTATAFLGLTLGCARCHDHKFDPIPQRDYYAMTAVFAGVRHGERPLPAGDRTDAAAAAGRDLDARIRTLEQQLAPFAIPADAAGYAARRPAVDFARNEEAFAPVTTRSLRMQIVATTGAEPCLDELEVWAGERNVALARTGATVTVSGTLPGYAIHQPEHLNDGLTGNEHSWISDTPERGTVQIDFARTERVDRVVWGRDRSGRFTDRLATQYWFEVRRDDGTWVVVAGADDRTPRRLPAYDLRAAPPAAAAGARAALLHLPGLRAERAAVAPVTMVHAATFAQPGPTHLLHRGDPLQPRAALAPATLSLFAPETLAADAPEQERRQALAAWITRKDHPLTWRVFVNRIWQYQFGQGLVATPNDFGGNGAAPSHDELLDWLASEFATGGGRTKWLQRQILTSATWRQSSAPRADAARIDAASKLLWRFPPRRLEAEAIRDSILAVSGNLDRTMGGPSFLLHDVDRENVYHYHPKDTFGPAAARRMIYARKIRMEQDAVFGAFDCPDGSIAMPRRSSSTTPLQSLNLLNSPFVLQQAEVFAARARAAVADEAAACEQAFLLACQRLPTTAERRDAVDLVRRHGLPALCRALLNSNEFLFVP